MCNLRAILISLFISTSLHAKNAGLDELLDYIVQPDNPHLNTESFTLIQNDKVIFEKYYTVKPEDRHILWSMSKTISSFIFGIAESEGIISRDDLVSKYYPDDFKNRSTKEKEYYSKMTIKNLLNMASGLGWNEYYEKAPFASHVVRMLYVEASADTAKYILRTPLTREPGAHFHYSSGDTNLLMGVLKNSMDPEEYANYPWKKFFDPMEIDAIFERDNSGTFFGASYIYLKTKDLLKLGRLILNKGKYKGKQVVPEKYVQDMITRSDVFNKNCKPGGFTYGLQIWLNHPCPGNDKKRRLPDGPESLVMYLGHGGQSIYIFPEENILAVRFAHDKHHELDRNLYAKLLLKAVKGASDE